MNQILMKRHLFLEGNRILGALIYYLDAQGRPCLKFSIEHKTVGDLWVEERKTGRKESALPVVGREMSIDVSYKFADHLLEIKAEFPGEKPWRRMTEVPTPPENYLFLIRLRDWQHLPVETPGPDGLILATPWSSEEVVIFVSFAGKGGKAFMPENGVMKEVEGKTIVISLPLQAPYDKIWIGIGEDAGNKEKYSLTVKAPNYRELPIRRGRS